MIKSSNNEIIENENNRITVVYSNVLSMNYWNL
jgi:hypothetical protein